jgi:ElaB/YqjD/DUF883 family membrane-anchored ribosome-binding protein
MTPSAEPSPSHSESPRRSAGGEPFDAKERAREALRGAAESAREAVKSAKDKASELEESLEQSIRDHPIRAVLIAGGVGLLLGMILGRRR